MNYQVLAQTASYYKEDREGFSTMCKAVEDLIKDEKKDIALRMLEAGKITVDEVAEFFDLSVEEVEELESTSHNS